VMTRAGCEVVVPGSGIDHDRKRKFSMKKMIAILIFVLGIAVAIGWSVVVNPTPLDPIQNTSPLLSACQYQCGWISSPFGWIPVYCGGFKISCPSGTSQCSPVACDEV